jgi:hypothetical protein
MAYLKQAGYRVVTRSRNNACLIGPQAIGRA